MMLSDERIAFVSKKIGEHLLGEGLIQTDDASAIATAISRAIVKYINADHATDLKVRTKIASLKRMVPEGSREWDILYQQYYEQALK